MWMGEITDFVTLYIQESDILEDEAKKLSVSLEDNIKDIIRPGQVGYDTGHLQGTVQGDYSIESDTLAIVTGWFSADYGKYWYRWKDGVNFLEEGMKKTLELYK